uniref:Protein kinase domain-containing protein n=1 Tax=Denticeps clupeoides TaxID=299321 RepID=A0AAY4DG38_9TELE
CFSDAPDVTYYVLIGGSALAVLTSFVFFIIWIKKYRSLTKTIAELRRGRHSPLPALPPTVPQSFDDDSEAPLQRQSSEQASGLPWKPPQVQRAELLQLIKAGKEGVFYKAKMTRGTCRGHSMVTCKIAKEGVSPKQVEREVSVMKKLGYHKNILQLLGWNSTQEPYTLIMEFVQYGTLRSFLQTQRDKLSSDPELQSLLTIASYHTALAMEHLHSKMVVHGDLALRNVMVGQFPWEVRLTEFGLARDMSSMRSRRSSRKKKHRERVPLRWYPPEYFRNNHYSFKGDVWAFGVLLWEMQTFGSVPYASLATSDEVVYHICAGRKNAIPDSCRPEITQILHDCWLEPYTLRPAFTDIVRTLENVMEDDSV